MAYCLDSFTISITGDDIPCTLTIDSGHDSHTFSANALTNGETLEVPFMYATGQPPRTVFASSYGSARVGTTFAIKPLGTRSFDPPIPDVSGGATTPKRGTFSVAIPAYSEADAGTLTDEGSHNHTVVLYLREATDRIGGTTPPANLEPPNPA